MAQFGVRREACGVKKGQARPSLPSPAIRFALLALTLATGCSTPDPLPFPRLAESRAWTATLATLPPMPEAGYTWRDLARHAIAANPDYAAILVEARAEYFRYKEKTDLRDLRLILNSGIRESDTTDYRYGADLRFDFPNPFVDKHVIRTGEAAQRETEAGAYAQQHRVARVIYELVQEVLSAERALQVLDAREQVLSEWAAHLKARHDAHVATQADVQALDLQRIRLKAAIQQKRLTAQAARRSLLVMTHIPDDALTLDPQTPDWPAVLDTLADEQWLLATARFCSPELAANRAALDKARAMLDTAKARQIPWFLYAQAGYGARDADTSDRAFDDWRLRIAINLPVFAWMSSEKKAAAAAIEAAILRREGIHQRIQDELKGHLADLRETLGILNDYRAALDAIPEPTRETLPDAETFYKLADARLSATEYALATELHLLLIYGRLLDTLGILL